MSIPATRLSLASSLKSGLHVFLYACVALVVLLGSMVAISAIVSFFRSGPVLTGPNVMAGLVCSLIVWLFVGVFHLRKETVQLRVRDRDKFQDRMQVILKDLGYEWVHMTDHLWSTRPAFRSLLFGAGITMELSGNKASINGPRLSLDLIRRKYRLASHLDKVQESISDSKSRLPEIYLKRVEMNLRLEPCHMEDFQTKVIGPLSAAGNLLVDVQLMLIAEDGLKESVWSKDIKPWLEENHIHHEFHRDHPQRTTPASQPIGIRGESFIDTCVWS